MFSKAVVAAIACFFLISHPMASAAPAAKPRTQESYKDLITKARNLTLQRDRLQASQVLQQALKRESKSSGAHRELARALDDLTGIFYTEKGQSLFAQAESFVDTRPRDALETYQAALRVEDGNVSILKAVARAHLMLAECDKADLAIKQAESLNPVSAEVRLLRLQALDCAGQANRVTEVLAATDVDLAPVEKFLRSLQIKDLVRRNDQKKARVLLASWETANPDYPEVQFWKWKLSSVQGVPDRSAALKYSILCQNLSPRKKKSFILDLELCKGRDKVEEYLKTSGQSEPAPSGE